MFRVDRKYPQLEKAKNIANKIKKLDRFYELIFQVGNYEMTGVSALEIADLLKTHQDDDVVVDLYRPWWRWSKAVAKFDSTYPNKIFLNERRINRSTQSIVNTLIHEWVHVVDNKYPFNFGHGGDSNHGKDKTAPYLIGAIAGSLANEFIQEN